MQPAPDRARLLEVVKHVVDECVAVVPDADRHRMRVASSLLGILHREEVLGDEVRAAETRALAGLVDAPGEADPEEVSRRVVEQLRNDPGPEFVHEAWSALVDVTRGDLRIARPGHDEWSGE
ncbi:DUF6285 domain-containing protein [Georgenia sp. SYP-B2076]|uniref:DUF6285 domain-containing protein n=1 Tax=Georgenia sp. SYP-B2076 TaxID=2495881 RepID=UPI000F8C37C0|nr:DUF6285 domain-containing protein [Georgenia sp. SYP-B2076]